MSATTLAVRLHKFIQHSYVLSRVSEKYNRLSFLASLDTLLLMDQWLNAYNFKVTHFALCKKIVQHKECLYKILPSTYNTSYATSLKRLTEMISEAENGLDPVNQLLNNKSNNDGIRRAQQ